MNGKKLLEDWQASMTLATAFWKANIISKKGADGKGEYSSVEQLASVIQMGAELGLGPMGSTRGIYLEHGKPSMAAELQAALAFRSVPGLRMDCTESTDERATYEGERPNGKTFQLTFTRADATRAGIKVNEQSWKKYPEAMLRARASSAIRTVLAPEAGWNLYTPEELGATGEAALRGVVTKKQVWKLEDETETPPADVPEAPTEPAPALDPSAFTEEVCDGLTRDEWEDRHDKAFIRLTEKLDNSADLADAQMQKLCHVAGYNYTPATWPLDVYGNMTLVLEMFLDADKEKPKPKPVEKPKAKQAAPAGVCANCGSEVSAKVRTYCVDTHREITCWTCQQAEKKSA